MRLLENCIGPVSYASPAPEIATPSPRLSGILFINSLSRVWNRPAVAFLGLQRCGLNVVNQSVLSVPVSEICLVRNPFEFLCLMVLCRPFEVVDCSLVVVSRTPSNVPKSLT